MKFNPKLPSVIFALNRSSKEDDIALIRTFYTGDNFARLKGKWKGEEELSYQLNTVLLDYKKFLEVLHFCSQKAYIQILIDGTAYLSNNDFRSYKGSLGTFQHVSGMSDHCTYCPIADMYWEAMT